MSLDGTDVSTDAADMITVGLDAATAASYRRARAT
jgi:hypothetical protein